MKASSRKGGVIPCGKRTDFGYDKDFGERYSLGKLLGHGQFGYTYVATDKSNGDRVAVKRIDKSKVSPPFISFMYFPLICFQLIMLEHRFYWVGLICCEIVELIVKFIYLGISF